MFWTVMSMLQVNVTDLADLQHVQCHSWFDMNDLSNLLDLQLQIIGEPISLTITSHQQAFNNQSEKPLLNCYCLIVTEQQSNALLNLSTLLGNN